MDYIKLDFPYCVYCGEPPEHWDHVFPLSKSWLLLSGFVSWLVPSCAECNRIAKAEVFKTFGDKTTYIKERLREKYTNELDNPQIQARINWEIKSLEKESTATKITDEKAIILNHSNKPTREEKEAIIGRRYKLEPEVRKKCKSCRKEFKTTRKLKAFCDIVCKNAWHDMRKLEAIRLMGRHEKENKNV